MNQSNTDYQDLLFNNPLFRSGVQSIQSDLRLSALRNNRNLMQVLRVMQNNPGFTADVMMGFARNFPGGVEGSLTRAEEIMESVCTQPTQQFGSSHFSSIDELQWTELGMDKKIKAKEELLKKYKSSRVDLIKENNSLIEKLNQDSQNIEEVPSEQATKLLDELKQLNKNIGDEQKRYSAATYDVPKIASLRSLIELKNQQIECLNQLIEIYKSTGKELQDANNLLKENINVRISEQKNNTESSNQVDVKLTGSIDDSKPSLFEKMATVNTKNKSENDIKPNMQHNNENLK